jgi:poly-gamma-glutamate synthesis protein (capsule biosynthesis protein)
MASAAAIAAGSGTRYNFAPLFGPITPIVESMDIAICHMETPIGLPDERPGVYGKSPFGGNLILAPNEIAAGLRQAGFDRCSTASNHSNDLAEPGIDTTLAALDAAGISHAGTARTPTEAQSSVTTVNGVRFAHLSYTRYSNTTLPAEPWRLNYVTSPTQIAADVDAVRAAGAEVVAVSVHISKELQPAPLAADRQFITDLTALAHIDLVIEHGPHVIQPVEQVNGTWVYWSVGNLISGMGTPGRVVYTDPRTLDGIAATARFTETAPGVFSVEPWPVLLFTAIADPVTSATIRAQMIECVQRSTPVVVGLH